MVVTFPFTQNPQIRHLTATTKSSIVSILWLQLFLIAPFPTFFVGSLVVFMTLQFFKIHHFSKNWRDHVMIYWNGMAIGFVPDLHWCHLFYHFIISTDIINIVHLDAQKRWSLLTTPIWPKLVRPSHRSYCNRASSILPTCFIHGMTGVGVERHLVMA